MKETLTIALLKEAEDGIMASNEVHTFSRQEAIERIAKALFDFSDAKKLFGNYDDLEEKLKKYVIKRAEVALNALLSYVE